MVSAAIIFVFIDRQTERVENAIGDVISSHTVVYEIRGTADSGLVTWMNAQGGIEQEQARIPFSKTYQMQYGDILSISVQNSEVEGTVICRIKVDGAVVKQSESSGAYVIAMCSGVVGE